MLKKLLRRYAGKTAEEALQVKGAEADGGCDVVERRLRLLVFGEVSDRAFDPLIIGIHCHVSVRAAPIL
jgi:hypothetical protein